MMSIVWFVMVVRYNRDEASNGRFHEGENVLLYENNCVVLLLLFSGIMKSWMTRRD